MQSVVMTDFLKYRLFDRLTVSRWYPIAVQVFTLAVFGLLIAGGLTVPHVSEKLAGTLRNTNLAALIVWSLWWPLVIISAPLFGRIWCQVCPMELVNSFFSRFGLKRKAPRFLTSGWGTVIFYSLALLGFIRTYWAHRYPERMSVFFLFLFVVVIIAGLIYEKRAFCNYLCPVGRLLGLYACCAPMEWRVRDRAICDDCRTKDCIAARNSYNLTARSCTSNLYPAAIADNRDCLLCTHCRKVCPRDNLRFSLRMPMADFLRGLRLGSVELFLLMVASGLVVWELAEEWVPARNVIEYLPDRAAAWLGLSGEAANSIHTLFVFILMPALLFLIPSLAGKWMGKTTLLKSAATFGLFFLPVVALGHLIKALFRITSRLPYYPLAFSDPRGIDTANLIAAGELQIERQIVETLSPWVTWISFVIFGAALLSVWLIGKRNLKPGSPEGRGRLSMVLIAMTYGTILFIITILARV